MGDSIGNARGTGHLLIGMRITFVKPGEQLRKLARCEPDACVGSPVVEAYLVIHQGPAARKNDVPHIAKPLICLTGREEPFAGALQHPTWVLEVEERESQTLDGARRRSPHTVIHDEPSPIRL